MDVASEVGDGAEGGASDGLACEDAEPPLDEVDPGAAFGFENGDSRPRPMAISS